VREGAFRDRRRAERDRWAEVDPPPTAERNRGELSGRPYFRSGEDLWRVVSGFGDPREMVKMQKEECERYWRMVHASNTDDLAAVCFPDKPRYFNLFFDRVQKFAVGEFLRRERVRVAGWRWLDLGCGKGRWLRYFSRLGVQACGIDVSGEAVDHCRGLGFAAEQGGIEDLPYGPGAFDATSSVTVLMHLPPSQRERAIAELSRVLVPGGLALLVEATRDSESAHVYGMGVDQWELAFAAQGLSLIHISGHCFGVWRNRLPRWLPFRDRVSIYLDYPVEFALMKARYGKRSDLGWQHVMVFRKRSRE